MNVVKEEFRGGTFSNICDPQINVRFLFTLEVDAFGTIPHFTDLVDYIFGDIFVHF